MNAESDWESVIPYEDNAKEQGQCVIWILDEP